LTTSGGDPFSSFTFGFCSPLQPLATFEEVASISSCQNRCLQSSRCDYFAWSKNEYICHIMEGSIRQFIADCNLIAGPIDIDLDNWIQDSSQCKVS
jgi:hypothetical protein